MFDEVMGSADLCTPCDHVRILEAQARELSRQGQTSAAMQKFITVAQICGPCLKAGGRLGCR